MNVPVEIARLIELTRKFEWVRPRPIATPIEVEIAKATSNKMPCQTKNQNAQSYLRMTGSLQILSA